MRFRHLRKNWTAPVGWIEGPDGHKQWDEPIGGQTWFWNPKTDKLYCVDKSEQKSPEHTYTEWLAAGWQGLDRTSMKRAMEEEPSSRPRPETLAELTLRAKAQSISTPFDELGFKKISYEWKSDKGHLAYDIDQRFVQTKSDKPHEQRIQGEIDPVFSGVIVGTIDLVPRTPDKYGGKYDGLEEMGTGRNQVPESVVTEAWSEAVAAGMTRWKLIARVKPLDESSSKPLISAERQNELIYGLVQLAGEVLDLKIGPGNALQYVAHQHVSSPDGTFVMIYGRERLGWKQDIILDARGSEHSDSFYALLGISNASFVVHLIRDFGNRLGISHLKSIAICRGGLDVYWFFE